MTQPQPTTPLPRGAYWEQRPDGSWCVARIYNWWALPRRKRTEPEGEETEE